MIHRSPGWEELTETERRLGCWVITGEEMLVGDFLVFLGAPMLVVKFGPYTGGVALPRNTRDVWVSGLPDAFMPVTPHGTYRILPRAEGASRG